MIAIHVLKLICRRSLSFQTNKTSIYYIADSEILKNTQ
jgi:hypothetical protein